VKLNLIADLLFFALAILAIRGARWAYVGLVMWILLHAPASIGFQIHPKACDLTVNLPLALQSLSNYPHMILYCIFVVVTALHFRLSGWQPLAGSIGLTVAMGAGMEVAQGLSGTHHCKAIDLIPDLVGAAVGLLIVVLGRKIANARLARRKGESGPIRGNQTAN
jgi:hypothetical protein